MEKVTNPEKYQPHGSSLQAQPISIIRGTAVVSVMTLLSRVLGFIRDLLIARGFGSSPYSDCFFVAFRIPNLLRSFVAEGALSSAFVPIFADSMQHSKSEAVLTIRRISGFILLICTILSAVGILFSSEIVGAFAPGFSSDSELMSLCAELTSYMMPIIICVSLVAMLNGALNTLGNFGASAWSQIWMNITLIAGASFALLYAPKDGVRILAISALAGSVIQIAVQMPALRKSGISVAPIFDVFNPQIKSLIKLMLPAIVGATVYQLGIFLNTMLASLLSSGSVSWLYYADRLIQFPLGTFSIALASVLLPALSISHSSGNQDDFEKKTFAALRYSSFFILPLAGFIFLLAEPITILLFERGEFTRNDTEMTAAAVKMYALGIWFVSSHSLFARSFIARKDTITSTLVGAASLCVNFISSLLLIGAVSSAGFFGNCIANLQQLISTFLPAANLGHSGLGLASSLASFFSVITLGFLSRKMLKNGWKDYLGSCLKNLIATVSAVYAACLLVTEMNLSYWMTVFMQTAAAISVWLLVCLITRNTELAEIWRLAKVRLKLRHN